MFAKAPWVFPNPMVSPSADPSLGGQEAPPRRGRRTGTAGWPEPWLLGPHRAQRLRIAPQRMPCSVGQQVGRGWEVGKDHFKHAGVELLNPRKTYTYNIYIYTRKHKNIWGIDGNDIIKTWSFMGARKVPQFVSQGFMGRRKAPPWSFMG